MKENKWKLESRREWQYYVMDSAVIQTTYHHINLRKDETRYFNHKKKMKQGDAQHWQCKTKILGGAEHTVVMLELRQQALPRTEQLQTRVCSLRLYNKCYFETDIE